MAKLGDLKKYENVLVSPLPANFRQAGVAAIPRQFYADWFELVVSIATIIYPPFTVPPLPEVIEFRQDSYEINPITDVYYFISVDEFILQGDNGFGVELKAYSGFQTYDGNDYIELKPIGILSAYPEYLDVSSQIRFDVNSPLATFFIWAEPAQLLDIEKILVQR